MNKKKKKKKRKKRGISYIRLFGGGWCYCLVTLKLLFYNICSCTLHFGFGSFYGIYTNLSEMRPTLEH